MNKQLRVSSTTSVPDLAGSITNTLKNIKNIEVRSIGASATNQAVKAIAVSTGHLEEESCCLNLKIGFDNIIHDGREKTVIVFYLSI